MKVLFSSLSIFLVSFSLMSCHSGSSKETSQQKQTIEKKVENTAPKWSVDNVLAEAEGNVGKEISFFGTVTHVCKHSGRQCFLAGSDPKKLVRVSATAEIKSFGAELTGSTIKVTGILRENRLDEAYLNKMEEKIKEEEAAHDHDHDHENNPGCESNFSKISALRKQLKESKKGYIPNYYVEGIRYEEID